MRKSIITISLMILLINVVNGMDKMNSSEVINDVFSSGHEYKFNVEVINNTNEKHTIEMTTENKGEMDIEFYCSHLKKNGDKKTSMTFNKPFSTKSEMFYPELVIDGKKSDGTKAFGELYLSFDKSFDASDAVVAKLDLRKNQFSELGINAHYETDGKNTLFIVLDSDNCNNIPKYL